jgi:hypothetical protein
VPRSSNHWGDGPIDAWSARQPTEVGKYSIDGCSNLNFLRKKIRWILIADDHFNLNAFPEYRTVLGPTPSGLLAPWSPGSISWRDSLAKTGSN